MPFKLVDPPFNFYACPIFYLLRVGTLLLTLHLKLCYGSSLKVYNAMARLSFGTVSQ